MSGGGGENRTPVRKHSTIRIYMFSSHFNLTERYPANEENERRFCIGFNGSATDNALPRYCVI